MAGNAKVRIDKLLSNLGYGSRKDVGRLMRAGLVQVGGEDVRDQALKVDPATVTVEGQPLDAAQGMLVALHKPLGYICSHKEQGLLVYDLFPMRWNMRNPKLASVGRLDADSTGLLLFTDDGQLLHRLTSPKHKVKKVYQVVLRDALAGNEKETFASGTLMLEGEEQPLLPCEFVADGERSATVILSEGRYHQVRRMFASQGAEVLNVRLEEERKPRGRR